MRFESFDVPGHPSWRAAVGTAVSYAVILLAMFFSLFLVPFLVFSAVHPLG